MSYPSFQTDSKKGGGGEVPLCVCVQKKKMYKKEWLERQREKKIEKLWIIIDLLHGEKYRKKREKNPT